jgi:hypothetical protein
VGHEIRNAGGWAPISTYLSSGKNHLVSPEANVLRMVRLQHIRDSLVSMMAMLIKIVQHLHVLARKRQPHPIYPDIHDQ